MSRSSAYLLTTLSFLEPGCKDLLRGWGSPDDAADDAVDGAGDGSPPLGGKKPPGPGKGLSAMFVSDCYRAEAVSREK